MQICRQLAGYSYGRADLVRRAMSKKKTDVMEQERQNFIYGKINDDGSVECIGALKNGVDEKIANSIFDEMATFASYAFNKSHAAAYAMVAYQTAYLKCHYKREYMAALLTSVLGNTDKVIEYIAECTVQSIKVLPPDINTSDLGFSVNGNSLNFGLLAIKNLGRGVIENIINERNLNGKFVSINDFIDRMYGKEINKRAIESLIKCGAFDSFPHNRMEMMCAYEGIVDSVDSSYRRNISGQIDLFSAQNVKRPEFILKKVKEYSFKELLAMEKEITGIFISGHPLDDFDTVSKSCKAQPISDILNCADDPGGLRDGDVVNILCVIQSKKNLTTKTKAVMAFLNVEDKSGAIEIVVFSKIYEQYKHVLMKDATVLITGKISMKEDELPKLLCEKIVDSKTLAYLRDNSNKKLYIYFDGKSDENVQTVIDILNNSLGDNKVCFHFKDTQENLFLKKSGILYSDDLYNVLKKVVGDKNIVFK